jgi:N-acetylglutamate synthase-like GNAT family acetyltransferase
MIRSRAMTFLQAPKAQECGQNAPHYDECKWPGLEYALRGNGRMNTHASSSDGYEHGHSFDTFRVRSFQATDQQQVMQLHAATAPGGFVDCDCAAKIEEIEEQYFRRPQDHFWVAEALGRIVGTVAMYVHDDNVAHLYCLRAVDESVDHPIRKGLVRVAASHAHHHGCLKLAVHAPDRQVDIGRAAEFLHRLGFEFSRHREVEKRSVLEFYLNLYERPELLPYEEAASPITASHRPE